MIYFFIKRDHSVFCLSASEKLEDTGYEKIQWLIAEDKPTVKEFIQKKYVGSKKTLISPFSSNVCDILKNIGIQNIERAEMFLPYKESQTYDYLTQDIYAALDQNIFSSTMLPPPILEIKDIRAYNDDFSLGLSQNEIEYLESISKKIKRNLTDSEVSGFAQINSEHCRHKIFNAKFIINDQEQEKTPFQWIKETSKSNQNFIISAYKDNVAFIKGPDIKLFMPSNPTRASWFQQKKSMESVLSLKAETHNFPTTVEPFNGSATGSGGEIRDRMAGGMGSIPLAGTAVYMTAYSRVYDDLLPWEREARDWLYQNPKDILLKASNGSSDFGNKFGQPLICGSLLTFENMEYEKKYGYDKVVMLAGGVGFTTKKKAIKRKVMPENFIFILGGDNYKIGLGGGSVSSSIGGDFQRSIEQSAIQRANPEMQKRVANVIRALVESDEEGIISIHDHGAGGHLNCIAEMVEESGGIVYLEELPIGDTSLSDKEILINESQERMGLIIKKESLDKLFKISRRERSPIFEVGRINSSGQLSIKNKTHQFPFQLNLDDLLSHLPNTRIKDTRIKDTFEPLSYDIKNFSKYLKNVLLLEAVACKDWLTNKVDRCVTGKVATQQTCGELQLPLNNLGVVALDFDTLKGIGTAIGHASVSSLIDPHSSIELSITRSLTNIVWGHLTHGLIGVSLSANWMWACKNPGEDTKFYEAVKAASQFAQTLKINIPTGKDSLSMVQKYPSKKKIFAPGTLITSAVAEIDDISKTISPVLDHQIEDSSIVFIDFTENDFELGGSSFAQTLTKIGNKVPRVKAAYLENTFSILQKLIKEEKIIAGHDIAAGGLVTTLLEMNFSNKINGLDIDLSSIPEQDVIKILFSEKPGVILQMKNAYITKTFSKSNLNYHMIGKVTKSGILNLKKENWNTSLDIAEYREQWYKTSFQHDKRQSANGTALARKKNKFTQPLTYDIPESLPSFLTKFSINRTKKKKQKAAIIREQGVNSDREMAYALWLAGFDVKDIHMTDIIYGDETFSDVKLIVFVGGFTYSDMLGSAKGWGATFKYNKKAKNALQKFYMREDTLSLGICNGCQLMMELELLYPQLNTHPKTTKNTSEKFECSFVNVSINKTTNNVFLRSLKGSQLGVWVAHREGNFQIYGHPIEDMKIPIRYSYIDFPGNINGSIGDIAALSSIDGRHLAMMPHLERSLFTWNWPHRHGLEGFKISPWIMPFMDAHRWLDSFLR